MVLTLSAVEERRRARSVAERVMFRVSALYGLSGGGLDMPLGNGQSVSSGPVCVTIDPEADSSSNLGIIDYSRNHLKVKYGIQAVFPGLFELVKRQQFDPALLKPVRAVATDECSIVGDYTGWHALGCLDFLPGSIWAGAAGG